MSNAVAQFARSLRREIIPPQFTTGPIQWGVVASVTNTKHTVDLYLDGTQRHNTPAYLTKGVRYLQSYAPAVGHVVAVFRGTGGLRSDRLVMGKCATGSTTQAPGVETWDGRKGHVVPEAGDYTAAQVGAVPATQALGGVLKGTLPDPEFTPSVASTWDAVQTALGWVATLTGTPGRFVGAHGGGPPSPGTYKTGDFSVDPISGTVYVCTVGGTPGTWKTGGGLSTPRAITVSNTPSSGDLLVATSTASASWGAPEPAAPAISIEQSAAWTKQAPTKNPPGRQYAAMAYDSSSSTAVLFGGKGATDAILADTWTWNGTTWTKESPTTSPPGLEGASMAYDSSSSTAVLFGGHTQAGTYLTNTWTWNGTNWTKLTPTTSPTARVGASMVYDSSSSLVVLFGGTRSNGVTLADTWTWNGTTWTKESPTTSPTARSYAVMAYDSSSSTAVLFGGSSATGTALGDTWTWNGTTWTKESPTTSPTARSEAAAAYGTDAGLVLFGGFTGLDTILADTWTWNGTTWTKHTLSVAPRGRYGAVMAYDTSTKSALLFGGWGTALLTTTWTFVGGSTTPGAPTAGQWAQGSAYLDVDDALWVCTVGGAPGTWVAANGKWLTWTPSIIQGTATPSFTRVYARYTRNGSTVTAACRLNVTGAGETGPGGTGYPVQITLPVKPLYTGTTHGLMPSGTGFIYNSTNGIMGPYACTFTLHTGEVQIAQSAGGQVGANPVFALATGDQITFTVTYQAA